MTVKDFGITKDGIATKLYTLKNNNLEISVTDFGSTLVSIVVPDRNNKPTDIVLGYDDVSGYETDDGYYFGCNVGRCANRIARGHFVLNNTEYNLDINNGPNNLHSGLNPYSKRVWTVENQNDTSITFSLESPHMDQGFPGALKMYVTYELLEDGFKINYNATPDKDTIINVTNHSYFNLNGEGSGTVLNHSVKIYADSFTPADETSIPTGEIEAVKDTPMDFNNFKTIGQDINKDYIPLKYANGYDHNWITDPTDSKLHNIMDAVGDVSGIEMKISTNCPGVQMYTANFVENVKGKKGHIYNVREAVCFEPQYYPDAINHDNFVSPVCKAGCTYNKDIIYKF